MESFMKKFLTLSTMALSMATAALCADQKPPAPKSKGEAEALQAMFGA